MCDEPFVLFLAAAGQENGWRFRVAAWVSVAYGCLELNFLVLEEVEPGRRPGLGRVSGRVAGLFRNRGGSGQQLADVVLGGGDAEVVGNYLRSFGMVRDVPLQAVDVAQGVEYADGGQGRRGRLLLHIVGLGYGGVFSRRAIWLRSCCSGRIWFFRDSRDGAGSLTKYSSPKLTTVWPSPACVRLPAVATQVLCRSGWGGSPESRKWSSAESTAVGGWGCCSSSGGSSRWYS